MEGSSFTLQEAHLLSCPVLRKAACLARLPILSLLPLARESYQKPVLDLLLALRCVLPPKGRLRGALEPELDGDFMDSRMTKRQLCVWHLGETQSPSFFLSHSITQPCV